MSALQGIAKPALPTLPASAQKPLAVPRSGVFGHPNGDAAFVREWLDFEPSTGILRWRVKPSQRQNAGDVAGHVRNGSRVIRIRRRGYTASRLAWLWTHGDWPDGNLPSGPVAALAGAGIARRWRRKPTVN